MQTNCTTCTCNPRPTASRKHEIATVFLLDLCRKETLFCYNRYGNICFAQKCKSCNAKLLSIPEIVYHGCSMHEKKNTCCICHRVLNRRQNLISHAEIHLYKFRYLCKFCEMHYSDLQGVRLHIRKSHKIPNVSKNCYELFNVLQEKYFPPSAIFDLNGQHIKLGLIKDPKPQSELSNVNEYNPISENIKTNSENASIAKFTCGHCKLDYISFKEFQEHIDTVHEKVESCAIGKIEQKESPQEDNVERMDIVEDNSSCSRKISSIETLNHASRENKVQRKTHSIDMIETLNNATREIKVPRKTSSKETLNQASRETKEPRKTPNRETLNHTSRENGVPRKTPNRKTLNHTLRENKEPRKTPSKETLYHASRKNIVLLQHVKTCSVTGTQIYTPIIQTTNRTGTSASKLDVPSHSVVDYKNEIKPTRETESAKHSYSLPSAGLGHRDFPTSCSLQTTCIETGVDGRSNQKEGLDILGNFNQSEVNVKTEIVNNIKQTERKRANCDDCQTLVGSDMCKLNAGKNLDYCLCPAQVKIENVEED